MLQSPHVPPVISRPASGVNGLGIFGFVVSLVGLLVAPFTCGFGLLISPVGLLASLIAMLWRPRGFAVAGTTLGGIGSGILAVVFGSMLTLHVTEKAAHERNSTSRTIIEARSQIEKYRADNGELPEGIEGNKLILEIKDSWNRSLRYEGEKGKGTDFIVRSAGPDGEFNTPDDITEGQAASVTSQEIPSDEVESGSDR